LEAGEQDQRSGGKDQQQVNPDSDDDMIQARVLFGSGRIVDCPPCAERNPEGTVVSKKDGGVGHARAQCKDGWAGTIEGKETCFGKPAHCCRAARAEAASKSRLVATITRQREFDDCCRRAQTHALAKTLLDGSHQVAVRVLARSPTGTTSAVRLGQSRPRLNWRSPRHCIYRKSHVQNGNNVSAPDYRR